MKSKENQSKYTSLREKELTAKSGRYDAADAFNCYHQFKNRLERKTVCCTYFFPQEATIITKLDYILYNKFSLRHSKVKFNFQRQTLNATSLLTIYLDKTSFQLYFLWDRLTN